MIFSTTIFFFIWFINILSISILKNQKSKQIILLASSYIFYYYFDTKFLWLLISISIFTYYLGLKVSSNNLSKMYTVFGITIITLIIAFFKLQLYFPSINNSNSVILPLGVSFFSFQAISYLVDVHKREMKPERSIVSFLMYVSFFPQLVAGPIERGKKLLPQLNSLGNKFDSGNIIGIQYVLYGFFLKLGISDNLNVITSSLLDEHENNINVILGLIVFYFQIYFDFHGYTNIAIGVGKTLGIELSKNFNLPIIADSIKDFWHRWHITLSTWFRDYLYIPLGGKNSKYKYLIILIVFVVSGIWHGPTYNFLFWGIYHGLLYIGESFLSKYFWINKRIRQIITFFLISFGWLFFYYHDLSLIGEIINQLICKSWIINLNSFLILLNQYSVNIALLLLGISIILIVEYTKTFSINKDRFLFFLVIDIMIIIVVLFGFIGEREFFYFKF